MRTALVCLLCLLPLPALAQAFQETSFIFNTLLFLICGFLVMFMAAGFCMLEAGLVRSSSVSTICVKNIALYSIAGAMFYFVGYNLMYSEVNGGWFGIPGIWAASDMGENGLQGSVASGSDWFFQMVFVATAASIVSGTIAERVKLWSFLVFVVILTGLLYPVTGAWTWGEGWLYERGFSDFAGSTIVHSVGGWAALVAVLLIGPRRGRFTPQGRSVPMPGSSLPLATLGTFVLWLGWFGFNGGSQLALGTGADAVAISNIFINTNMGAVGGLLAAMMLTQITFKKVDPTLTLNGALAGLVSITAEPLMPTPGIAMAIGACGGALMFITVLALDKRCIDDVVGAIPVHLVCGIWGTLAVPLTNPKADIIVQLLGVSAIGAFTLITSLVALLIIQRVMGLRVSAETEERGVDQSEVGLDAYPEFVRASSMMK